MNSLLKLYKYSPSEQTQLLKSIVILTDTREQKNSHIIEYLDKQHIQHKQMALTAGDYSFMVPANNGLGINRDIYFNGSFMIERKANLEELSGNLAQERERFENEFLRASPAKIILLIESGCYADIVNHNYKTQLNEKAYIASVLTFAHRYNINVSFIPKELAGQYIYLNCYYYLKEQLL